jgi:hypothetical protein
MPARMIFAARQVVPKTWGKEGRFSGRHIFCAGGCFGIGN